MYILAYVLSHLTTLTVQNLLKTRTMYIPVYALS